MDGLYHQLVFRPDSSPTSPSSSHLHPPSSPPPHRPSTRRVRPSVVVAARARCLSNGGSIDSAQEWVWYVERPTNINPPPSPIPFPHRRSHNSPVIPSPPPSPLSSSSSSSSIRVSHLAPVVTQTRQEEVPRARKKVIFVCKNLGLINLCANRD